MEVFGGGGSSNGIGLGANGGIKIDYTNSAGIIQLQAGEGPAGTDGVQPFQTATGGAYRVPSGKTLQIFLMVSNSGTAGLRFGLGYSTSSIARNAGSIPATATFESGTATIYNHKTIAGSNYEPMVFSFPALSYPCYQAAATTAMSVIIFGREV